MLLYLYGGHNAKVRKSSSELTTRAPVLLFCEGKNEFTVSLAVNVGVPPQIAAIVVTEAS